MYGAFSPVRITPACFLALKIIASRNMATWCGWNRSIAIDTITQM
jgi:hypothetical protein